MPRKKPLPTAGSVFTFPLLNGLIACCWVIQNRIIDTEPSCLVVCLTGVHEQQPKSVDEIKIEALICDHHEIQPKTDALWITEAPSKDFVLIGSASVPKNYPLLQPEKELETFTFGGWMSFHYDAITQWRWENDRDALLAEEAEQEQIAEERYEAAVAKFEEERRSMTLEKLAKYTFFPQWDDHLPQNIKTKSRRNLRALAKALIHLGDAADMSSKMVEFEKCVLQFNKLSEKHDEFTDTEIRENLIDALLLFEHASGCHNLAEQIDLWREW